jgi:hypothetical protein
MSGLQGWGKTYPKRYPNCSKRLRKKYLDKIARWYKSLPVLKYEPVDWHD